jgi:prepilin-type N-terminal cleavage/methylation domain-containing protein
MVMVPTSYVSLKSSVRAFTLIELLVVIAIIGVLASVVLASLNTARDKTQYTTIAQQFREIEKAFNFIYSDNGCWPRENTTQTGACAALVSGSTANPTLVAGIASVTSDLRDHLPAAPVYPYTSTAGYGYDNDGDTYVASSCTSGSTSSRNTNAGRGVNIIVQVASDDVFSALERIFDGTDGTLNNTNRYCGKLRYNTSNSIIYSISSTP